MYDRLTIVSTLLLLLGLMSHAWLSPEGFSRQLQKDRAQEQSGIIEHLTVLVLVPGTWKDRLPWSVTLVVQPRVS